MKKIWMLLVLCCLCQSVFARDVPKIRVYNDKIPGKPLIETSDNQEIAKVLKTIGVRFEQWEASQPLPKDLNQEGVIAAYKKDVDRLVHENGFQSIDVVRMFPDNPKKEIARQKFLNEHTHAEDEVRFFVEGSGLFCLHIQDKVYLVQCEQGDLISIPAGTTHWFDMGTAPHFTAIRFFVNSDGWIGNFTGNEIAQLFPKFDEK